MSKIVKNIQDFILNQLKEQEGNEYYLCDIGMTLSESENADGSWYCSTYEAKQEVVENWDFCGMFYEYYESNFGSTDGLKNPFDNVESFHCSMMIFAVEGAFNYAVNNSENYSDYETWNKKVEITEEFILEIKEALENLSESDIF